MVEDECRAIHTQHLTIFGKFLRAKVPIVEVGEIIFRHVFSVHTTKHRSFPACKGLAYFYHFLHIVMLPGLVYSRLDIYLPRCCIATTRSYSSFSFQGGKSSSASMPTQQLMPMNPGNYIVLGKGMLRLKQSAGVSNVDNCTRRTNYQLRHAAEHDTNTYNERDLVSRSRNGQALYNDTNHFYTTSVYPQARIEAEKLLLDRLRWPTSRRFI